MKTDTLTERKWDFEIIPAEGEIHIFDIVKNPSEAICSIYAQPFGNEEIQTAKLICKAVNNYDALLSAIDNLPKWLEDAANSLEAQANRNGNTNALTPKLLWYAGKIKEAIKKAEQ